ncbi:MAG TPA: TonB-dependent receptor [Puia sp.]|nr:TonB-dependent receptor [Puia sp.]
MKNSNYTFLILFALLSSSLHPARASDKQVTQLPAALNTANAGTPATPPTVSTGDEEDNRGTVKGKVTTADGQSAGSVTVVLKSKGIFRYTITEEDGSFTLRNLPVGSYDLEISLTGFATTTQNITVENKKTTDITIRLQLSGQQLQEVVVTGGHNKFSRSTSNYVAKMPLKNMENPQVYTTITKDLMADQLVFSVDDAIRNATGIQKMWDATGRSGDGGGYYNSRGFILQSQLRNGIAGNVTSKIDASNLERLEVIKGPSATLFGSTLTSYGGLINRVTKKPYATFGGEVTWSGGNFGFNRVSADINTPLDSAKKVLLRVNTAYLDEGSFQDNGFNKNFAFAPSLSYKINDRLTFLFDAEIYRGRNLGTPIFFFPYGQTIASMGVSRADQLPIDYKRSFFSDDLSQQSANTNFFAQLQYRINDKWSTQTNVTVTNSYSDGPSPYFYLLSNSAVTGNPSDIGSDYISRNDQFTANSRDRMLEIQQNLNGEFNIGSLNNRFVAGLDFFNQNSNQLFSGGTLDTIASHGDIPTYRDFNRTSLQNLYATKGVDFYYPVNFIANTYSAYAADVLNLTDNLLVMAALRVDHFVNQGNYDPTTGTTSGGYNQTAFSPKFGIVFQPLKDRLSLFANYQNGFTNKTGTDYHGNVFKPEHANQAEAGIKLDLFEGKLTSTISAYTIKVNDIVRAYVPTVPDPTLPTFPQIQDGTQVSKGIEAEVIASPIQGLNIVAGFSYNDSKYEKADADVAGRRPGTASSPYTANWWISYRLPAGTVKGLGLGFGGNYASDNKVINSVSQGVFTLPAYTVLNATIFYEYSKFRFAVKSDNFTNQKYWIGYTTVNPQKLRSVAASISFKF